MGAVIDDLPKYSDLMLPTLKAVDTLGGSGSAREITEQVLAELRPSDDLLELAYENRPTKSVYVDRLDWARSYCKLGGALESPRRGVFLVSALGREILDLPEPEAVSRLAELDRQVRADRRRRTGTEEGDGAPEGLDEEDAETGGFEEQLLTTLHALSPAAFEEFCLYVLRECGMELSRVGGSGDEGIDGIGRAPISDVLSATVAVQCKRWDPTSVVPRERVALFQRDAAAAGAERAVIITLGRFSEPARKAAGQATPTVDLIDGQKLCALVRQHRIGVIDSVDAAWFARFES